MRSDVRLGVTLDVSDEVPFTLPRKVFVPPFMAVLQPYPDTLVTIKL